MSKIQENRNAMKCPNFSRGMRKSDQQIGVEAPPYGKKATGKLITLPSFDDVALDDSFQNLIEKRRSVRVFDEDAKMSQAQLAFLLYSTFGITSYASNNVATLRKAPSGGARHAFELYVVVRNIDGLEAGVYHYLPVENVGEKVVTIEFLGAIEDYEQTLANMLAEQNWVKTAQCVLFVTSVPYKAEWRYGELAHRVILIDLGHLGQNAVLSTAAIGAGACPIAAFDQKLCDRVLKVDGENEFTVYSIVIGVPKS
ncbi:MAG: SagB/ThcOx family dehydrogenase [Defluviitaleaceae bacterium]|nr:SagB/ThcOx family dehydrogenase [Defluviitaleaceae bacterium]